MGYVKTDKVSALLNGSVPPCPLRPLERVLRGRTLVVGFHNFGTKFNIVVVFLSFHFVVTIVFLFFFFFFFFFFSPFSLRFFCRFSDSASCSLSSSSSPSFFLLRLRRLFVPSPFSMSVLPALVSEASSSSLLSPACSARCRSRRALGAFLRPLPQRRNRQSAFFSVFAAAALFFSKPSVVRVWHDVYFERNVCLAVDSPK